MAGGQLPTIGQFIQYVSPKEDLLAGSSCLLTLPINKFVDAGVVALCDLASFLETDTGKELCAKSLQIIELKKDSVAWIPHGTLVQPLCLLDSKAMKCGSFFTLPVFSKSLGEAVPIKTRGPALAYNLDFLQKHSGQPVFAERLALLNKFKTACEEAAAA